MSYIREGDKVLYMANKNIFDVRCNNRLFCGFYFPVLLILFIYCLLFNGACGDFEVKPERGFDLYLEDDNDNMNKIVYKEDSKSKYPVSHDNISPKVKNIPLETVCIIKNNVGCGITEECPKSKEPVSHDNILPKAKNIPLETVYIIKNNGWYEITEECSSGEYVKLNKMNDCKVDDYRIINERFKGDVYVVKYNESNSKAFINLLRSTSSNVRNNILDKSYFLAFVTVNGENYSYLVYCKNANNQWLGDGLFERSEAQKIEILSCGSDITNMSYMFSQCSKLTELKLSNVNTSSVTNMEGMFSGCSKLTKLDLSSFNTRNVQCMNEMFSDCSSLIELKLSHWDTCNVTGMREMFENCNSLTGLDLSKWDTSNVKDMCWMFANCSNLTSVNLSEFNTSNVWRMSYMFFGCTNLAYLKLTSFDISSVQYMRYMFAGCKNLTYLDLSSFNISKDVDIYNMFGNCFNLEECELVCSLNFINYIVSKSFNSIGLEIDVNLNIDDEIKSIGQVQKYICLINKGTIVGLEEECESIVGRKCERIQIFNSESENSIFIQYKEYGKNIKLVNIRDSSLCVGGVVNAAFEDEIYVVEYKDGNKEYDDFIQFLQENKCKVVNIEKKIKIDDNDNGKEVIKKVYHLSYMFTLVTVKNDYENKEKKYIIYCSDANSKQNEALFKGSKAIEIEVLGCGSNLTNICCMFQGCDQLINIKMYHFDTRNVVNMGGLFDLCSSLTELDLSHLNTSKVKNMSNMFSWCTNLTVLNLDNLNTGNVIDMNGMFSNCHSLKDLDISKLDTRNVTDMAGMFYGCYDLTNLNLGNINTKNVTDMSSMFYGCSKLTNINLSQLNTQSVVKMGFMFKNCSSLESVSFYGLDTSSIQEMQEMFAHCTSLANIDLSYVNTKNVINMSNMFSYCSSLTNLDLSNFNTRNVTDMSCMFYGCSSLKELNLENFIFKKVTNMSNMFAYCSSLISLVLNNYYNDNKTVNMHFMFFKCFKSDTECQLICNKTFILKVSDKDNYTDLSLNEHLRDIIDRLGMYDNYLCKIINSVITNI